jgi:CHAT domain-containing protein
LKNTVYEFVHDEANPLYAERAAQRGRELWDLLIAPFAARIPARGSLVLVPHGPLHELPFEALFDPDGKPLFERWAVSVAPSVSTLARARERHKVPQSNDSFLAFSSGRGLELPEDEVAEVAQLFGNNKAAFKPTEARFENYERLVPGAHQLLIATAGTYAPGDHLETYLEILPTKDVHDSRLSGAEIAAQPLASELVTLAACDTARGEALLSDERLDLTRAFLIAGAASVLATRWKVPEDPATSRFLLDFYRAYRQGGPEGKGLRKDQALTEARRLSRERGDPAQLWAAWVLVGDPR